MKQAVVVALLVITAAVNSSAAEATPPAMGAAAHPQGGLSPVASEAWQLPSKGTWSPISFKTDECGRKITVNYWGYVSGGDACYQMCGPCVPEKIVGQIIYECDGTITQWGLTDCELTSTTSVRCGTCGPGGGPGGGEN